MVQIRVSPTVFSISAEKQRDVGKNSIGSGGIRTHASEETGALNQRLRPLGHATHVKQAYFNLFILSTAISYCSQGVLSPKYSVYGHIMLNTPVLVRSLKLSNIEPC